MNHKQLLFQGAKICGAAILAIAIAVGLGLDYPLSAGIIAILSIQPTKKETIKTALGRLYAFLAALAIAVVSFRCLGFTYRAFGLYLLLFIPICLYNGWHGAMAMDSVLISHFISSGSIGGEMIRNECLLFAVGVGVGVLTNLHLRKNKDHIELLKQAADDTIRGYLNLIADNIAGISCSTDEYYRSLGKAIRLAENAAEDNYKNQFGNHDTYDMEYVRMRRRQSHILYEMDKVSRRVLSQTSTSKGVEAFFRKVSREYSSENQVDALLEDFVWLDGGMKKMPLPESREEFEDRAGLFALLRLMEEFLREKARFMEKNGKTSHKAMLRRAVP